MSSIKSEITASLNWLTDYVISSATGIIICSIKDTKLYVSVVALSSEDNAKLLEQLNQVSKEQLAEINVNQSNIKTQNQYLDYLIDPAFQGVNRLFDLFLDNNNDRTRHTGFSYESRNKRI